MRIGIAGYIATSSLAPWLDDDPRTLPLGFPGAPLFGTLIKALLDRGHEVGVFTLSEDLPPGDLAPRVVHGRGVTVYYCPYRKHSFRPNGRHLGRSLDFFRRERASLVQAMRDFRPQIVNAHWTYELAMAAIDSGLPYVVTCHDSPVKVLKFFRNAYRFGRLLMARSVLRRARHLTAVSPYLRDEIQWMARAPIEVVPNPLALSILEMSPAGPRAPIGDRPRIAMVQNGWIDLKNPRGGLAAFGRLRRQLPGAELHVFGTDYEPGGPADTWARSAGLASGVTFHGPTPAASLLRTFQDMHFLLHPSLEEAGSMVVSEAMALGLPVIGGEKSGAMPWLTGHGAAGIMTDVRDPQALCDAMLRLIRDPALYDRLVAGAVERARSVFSADSVVLQYEAAFQRALSSVR